MNIQAIANRVAEAVIAKERPTTLFQATFFDLRVKVKDIKSQLAAEAKTALDAALNKGLRDHGYDVVAAEIKLGRYRGSEFVTSAPVQVRMKDETKAKKLEAYLQTAFDPKYTFKGFTDDGVASFNTR